VTEFFRSTSSPSLLSKITTRNAIAIIVVVRKGSGAIHKKVCLIRSLNFDIGEVKKGVSLFSVRCKSFTNFGGAIEC